MKSSPKMTVSLVFDVRLITSLFAVAYGITTGFGMFASTVIDKVKLK